MNSARPIPHLQISSYLHRGGDHGGGDDDGGEASNESEGGEVNWLEQDWSGKRICNGRHLARGSSSQ